MATLRAPKTPISLSSPSQLCFFLRVMKLLQKIPPPSPLLQELALSPLPRENEVTEWPTSTRPSPRAWPWRGGKPAGGKRKGAGRVCADLKARSLQRETAGSAQVTRKFPKLTDHLQCSTALRKESLSGCLTELNSNPQSAT